MFIPVFHIEGNTLWFFQIYFENVTIQISKDVESQKIALSWWCLAAKSYFGYFVGHEAHQCQMHRVESQRGPHQLHKPVQHVRLGSGYTEDMLWLVVYLPLWKIFESQLGWWHSQYVGKKMFQTTNQYWIWVLFGSLWFFFMVTRVDCGCNMS